ncbi:MAG: exo-alpha-sialidase [Ruminiclostridium sp.]|nr:exo-alpha-sialidase [Ruminiclostridium sp.]
MKFDIKIIGSFIVSGDVTPENNSKFYTFPSPTRCMDGAILCCTLVGSEKSGPDGRIKLYKSTDECETWSEMDSPTLQDEKNDSGYGYLVCHITEIEKECLLAVYVRVQRFNREEPLFHPKTDGIQYSEVRITKSYDNGKNWTQPMTLDYILPDIIIPGKCLVLPDGTMGIPCEVWHEWDKGFKEGPSSRLIFSYDNGKTWPGASIMAIDKMKESIYGDPRLTILEDGRLIALFWRYCLKTGEDIPVHRVESEDNGKTWSEPYNTGIAGQIANPISLFDGLMLCIFQKRFGDPGIKAVLSYDNGVTWDTKNTVEVWKYSAQGEASWVVDKDGVHPNNLGHLLIANKVFEVIASNCSCLSVKAYKEAVEYRRWSD